MILGKKSRPPINRTTSMTEITFDLNPSNSIAPPNSNSPYNPFSITPTISPTNPRRNSADGFLTTCHLCNRRLTSGRDIFMYRGDSAFCSFECRQKQMNQDEKKVEKLQYSLMPKKLHVNPEYSSNANAKMD